MTLIVNFLARSIHNVFLYILWPVACMSLFFFLTILCIKSSTPKHATTQHGESFVFVLVLFVTRIFVDVASFTVSFFPPFVVDATF